ncbi:MAG: tyrosine/phenylalanine carboxypeptidase domain-containing protein [Patescibacteria group bacterium]
MSLLKNSIPTNLAKEKIKFFASNTYNPIFQYKQQITPENLTKYGQPSRELFEFSLAMLKQHGIENPQNSDFLTKSEIEIIANDLCLELRIDQIPVIYSAHRTSKIAISQHGLIIREPITLTRSGIQHNLNHEIQTHYLRSMNNKNQPWKSQPQRDVIFRRTEEGLANLHNSLHKGDKFLLFSFVHYFSNYLAITKSFREVFDALVELGLSPERAWNVTLRKKRGLTDTSQPGGFTKDIVYLEGAIIVWKWLMANNDPKRLYLGKIAVEEVEKFWPIANKQHLLYPTFFRNMTDYLQEIAEIGKVNQFDLL